MARARGWAGEVVTMLRESRSPRAFLRVMRVRLSQSKVGRWVCPAAITVEVDLRSLGPSVQLRSHTTDICVLGELISSGTYVAAARCLPDRGAGVTIVDLGANTGLAARWFLAGCPGARVVCVEPEPGNVEVLRRNVEGVDPPATVFPVCVGAVERRVSLTSTHGEFAFTMNDDPDGDVDVMTLDRILEDAGVDRIDLLKCDIEGAERELFDDCSAWIGKVRAAVVECHDRYSAEDLQAALRRNGATLTVVDRTTMEGFGCELVTLTAT